MEAQKEPSYWAAGWSAFAGIMLIMLGLFHARKLRLHQLAHLAGEDA